MAFGKDANNLNKVTAYGGNQSLKAQNRMMTQARPARRAGAPYFVGAYKPIAEDGANPDMVRLIKGEYKVQMPVKNGNEVTTQEVTLFYYPTIEHTFMVGPRNPRGFICSGGPLASFRDHRETCHGCDNYFNNKSNKSSPHGRADLYVFSMLHFGLYAKTNQKDKDGNLRINEKTNEPYYEWLRIFPQERRHYENNGIELRDWNLMHWPMKFGAFNTVSEYDEQVSKCCRTCGGRFTINTLAWLCSSCGIDLLDPNDGTLQKSDIDKLTSGPVTCSHCQHVGMLQEFVECSSCSDAQRADIFDVDLMVKRVKNTKTDKLELMMMGFEGPRPLDARFTVPGEDGRKPIAHALDLPHIYAPSTLEIQEGIMGGSTTGRTSATPDQFQKPWGTAQTGAGAQTGSATGGQGPNYG